MEKSHRSDLSLLFVAAIWGMNFVAVKHLLADVSPVNLILFRFLAGSGLLFLLLFFREDVKIPWRDFWRLMALGALGITIYQFAFTYALKYTSVTNVCILINTAPLYGGVLSSLCGMEKFKKKRLLAVAVGFVGVCIIITRGDFQLHGGDTKGNLLAVAASLLWALYTILSKPLLDRHSPLKVTTYCMVTGALLLLPFAPFSLSASEFTRLDALGWGYAVFAVVFSIVIAFFLWYKGVREVGPSRTMVYQYLVPVFAAFFSYLLLGEPITLAQCAGAFLVFSSIAMARRT